MSVRQLSVFLENKAGRIADMVGVVAGHSINVFGFSLAYTADYGIVRLVVDRVDEARRVLDESGYATTVQPVVCAEIPNRPGALASVAQLVYASGRNIEYMYLGAGRSIFLKTDDIEALEALLVEKGLRLLTEGDAAQIDR